MTTLIPPQICTRCLTPVDLPRIDGVAPYCSLRCMPSSDGSELRALPQPYRERT